MLRPPFFEMRAAPREGQRSVVAVERQDDARRMPARRWFLLIASRCPDHSTDKGLGGGRLDGLCCAVLCGHASVRWCCCCCCRTDRTEIRLGATRWAWVRVRLDGLTRSTCDVTFCDGGGGRRMSSYPRWLGVGERRRSRRGAARRGERKQDGAGQHRAGQGW